MAIESRILAVFDTFNAKVSHRPCRPAFSREVALAELVHEKGTKYDGTVVDMCVRLIREQTPI